MAWLRVTVVASPGWEGFSGEASTSLVDLRQPPCWLGPWGLGLPRTFSLAPRHQAQSKCPDASAG